MPLPAPITTALRPSRSNSLRKSCIAPRLRWPGSPGTRRLLGKWRELEAERGDTVLAAGQQGRRTHLDAGHRVGAELGHQLGSVHRVGPLGGVGPDVVAGEEG